MKRKKITKSEFVRQLNSRKKLEFVSGTSNAYDLNETGGFINDT